MNPAPLSPDTFKWVLTILIVAGALWALFDIVKLSRTRGKDASDPLVGDERFGYWIGIIIGLFALGGVLRFHDVF